MKKKKIESAASSSLDLSLLSHSPPSTKTQQALLTMSQTESPTLLLEQLRGEATVSWSDMPVELLEKLVGNLDEIADRIKFGAVCKRWRSALKSSSNPPRARLPWLLLFQKINNKVMKFYSLSNDKTYSINHNLKGLMDSLDCVCGSDSGWLIMAKITQNDPVCPLLYNPISGYQISLPQLPNSNSIKWVCKCNITVSPKDDSLVIIMNAFPETSLLYCYRLHLKSVEKRPTSWTSFSVKDLLRANGEAISHLTYYRDCYFISVGERLLTAFIDPDTKKVVSVVPPLALEKPRWAQYFVQSSTRDELFLVLESSVGRSKKFEVFRWDSTEQHKRWSKVRNIGSDTFFYLS